MSLKPLSPFHRVHCNSRITTIYDVEQYTYFNCLDFNIQITFKLFFLKRNRIKI